MRRMLSTSAFAAAIGISESSVRRLADAGDLEIHRTKGGHRRIPVTEAIRYVRESDASVLRPDLLGLATPDDAYVAGDKSQQLLDALTGGFASQVSALVQAMYASGNSIAEICDGPVHQAMSTIGSHWPSDKRGIFVEHRATLLCLGALCQVRPTMPEADRGAPTAIGAGPQDDPYLLPTMMASLVLHDCGYDETNLGPNTPIDVLTDAVEDERPDLVWLAITNPIRSRQQVREIDDLASMVKSCGGNLLIGGKNADTYENAQVTRCASMIELNDKAISFRDA
jgi:excisionase family DNA binding protein